MHVYFDVVPSLLLALDDIIKSKPKGRGGKAGGRPSNSRKVSGGAKAAAIGGKAANAAAVVAANRNKPLVIPGRASGGNQGSKIIVSNLPLDVTEAQVKVSRQACRRSLGCVCERNAF